MFIFEYRDVPFNYQENVCFRFRTVSFQSKNQTRSIRLTNISSVPIMISFHIFLKDESEPESPFNLICEIPEDIDDFVIKEQMFVSQKYYGREIKDKLFVVNCTEHRVSFRIRTVLYFSSIQKG